MEKIVLAARTHLPGWRAPSERQVDAMTMYYDGACPLCLAEIEWLASRNARDLLRFVDIAVAGETLSCGLSCEAAMLTMHARLDDGSLLHGAAVFAAAYQRAGLPRLAWLVSRPWLQPLLGPLYSLFARHRMSISRLIGPAMLRLSRWTTASVHLSPSKP